MRHILDYAVKFVLLFFIVARFTTGPAPQATEINPPQEPSSDIQS